MPKVSFVMPVRDHEEYLDESIQSVLNQTEQDFEFLIFSDRCSSLTLEKLQEYSNDNRVKIFTNDRIRGITAGLNFLIENTKSDIIARQDSDDISDKERLSVFFQRHNNSTITTSNFFVKTDNLLALITKDTSPLINLYRFLFFYNFGAHGQLFFKKQYYNSRFLYCQDYELCSEILRKDFKDFNLIENPLYTYRKHLNCINKKHRTKQIYFSLLTAQQNIYHFLGIRLTLNKVHDLRNYFLENKKPKYTSETLFLSLVNTLSERFKVLFCKCREDEIEINNIIKQAYTVTFSKVQ